MSTDVTKIQSSLTLDSSAKAPLLLAFVVGLAACHRAPNVPPRQMEVPQVASPSKDSVIGALGIPLGTVAEIRASIVAGSETRMMQYQSRYLLRVSEVNGRPLEPAPSDRVFRAGICKRETRPG